ncbi:MAG: HNH endonuclease [Gemmatimonadetes bacterium]|nr:HNH endonuclease [Gemmatimonadota bacterium]
MNDLRRKTCYRCKKAKSPTRFTRRRDGRVYDMCRGCVSEVLQRRPLATRTRLHHTASHRTCYLCTRSLTKAHFTRRTVGTYFSACKDCNSLVFAQRRRARLLAAEGEFTRAEWELVLARFDACPDCKRAWDQIPLLAGRKSVITVDHITPISRNGTNYISNIRPLCYACNSRKGDRSVPAR